MKKTLIALAVLTVSTASFAQGAVTLYGVIDLAHSSNKVGTTKSSGITSGIASGGRIGVKGTEDLGGGLTANFTMEYSVQPDLATTSMANRQSFVGLGGGFGSLNIGRQYTLIHGLQGSMDPLGNHTGQGWLAGSTSTVRSDQTVIYTTPAMGGFSAALSMASGAAKATAAADGLFVLEDGTGPYEAAKAAATTDVALRAPVAAVAKGDGETTGIALNYAAGPLSFKVASETSKNTALKYTLPGASSPTTLGGGATTDTKRLSIGASYDLGMAKLSVVNAKADAGAGELKATSFGIGVPMGAMMLGASISNGSYTNGGSTKGDLDGSQIGGTYSLSKRTTAYLFVGNAKIENGAKNTSTSVGIRHTF